MGRGSAQSSGRIEQLLVAGAIAVAIAALAALVLAPRSGEPVALVPLGESAGRTVPTLIASPDTLLLARGSLPGSYIVRGQRPGFFDSLTRHGVLVLNATAPGCGPAAGG